MLLQNIRAKFGARLSGDSEAGFTLIELLVVMLILGILAAIALPAFFNQKEKAGDAKAKEYVHSAQTAIETYSTENGGSYAAPTGKELKAELIRIEPTLSSAAGLAAEAKSSGAGYKVTVQGAKSTQLFWVEREASGVEHFQCEKAGVGGCPPAASGEIGNWENG